MTTETLTIDWPSSVPFDIGLRALTQIDPRRIVPADRHAAATLFGLWARTRPAVLAWTRCEAEDNLAVLDAIVPALMAQAAPAVVHGIRQLQASVYVACSAPPALPVALSDVV